MTSRKVTTRLIMTCLVLAMKVSYHSVNTFPQTQFDNDQSLENGGAGDDLDHDEGGGGQLTGTATAADGGGGVSFVADVPEFVSSNTSLSATEGETLTLSCQVNNLAGYQIIWYRRRKQPPQEDWKILRVGGTPVVIKNDDARFSFESDSTILRIKDIEEQDQGLYKCEVAVENSPKVYLDVRVNPRGTASATAPTTGAATASSTSGAITVTTAVLSLIAAGAVDF